MKNQKLLAVATLAGLTLGGLSVTAASAQETEDSTQASTVDGEYSEGRGHRGGCDLEAAAVAIGIDEADLRAALDGGDSIADIAEANGVEVDSVIEAMVEAKASRIDEKVAEGRITQEEADEKLADLEARVTDRVNGEEAAEQA